MSQPKTPITHNWLQYLILIVIAGLVGTGVALFITSRHNAAPNIPVTNEAIANTNSASATPSDPFGKGQNTTPSTPTTHDEPPPMLAGNMPAPQAALTLGNWYFDHQNWKKAIDKYEAAIKLGIDNADVRTDLGSAYRFSGNAQKALEEYQHAHKMNPQHENSLFNQGAIYVLMLKQPQKGVEVWKEYIKEFPQGKSVDNAKKLIAQAEKEFKLKK
ncbi:MAG: tetratricopeptide repeat protein [Abditibacteriaceae bacterium]